MLLSAPAPREEYHTVHIRIFAPVAPDGTYGAELSLLGWRGFPHAQIRLDLKELLLLDGDPKGYGIALGQMVFADDALGKAYAETLATIQGRGDGLRVRLQCDPLELQEIRWERMYHPIESKWRPLGSSGATPFSRYVSAQQWDRPESLTGRPLQVLAVIASPSNLDANYHLDSIEPEERQALHTLLDGIKDISVTYLESGTVAPPTIKAIRGKLAWDYSVVHFLCHGAKTTGGTVLYLEGEDGKVEPIAADRLVEATKTAGHPPALVFLAACETAARSAEDAFAPLGPALVEDGGVQTVIAMSEKVGVHTSREFAGQFYARLFAHGMVDLAVNEARALVQDAWDWGAPVLFSRLQDNQLIDFPVGSIYPDYLSHTGHAVTIASDALVAARQAGAGQQLVDNLNALIEELRRSHKVLADQADPFRALGRDPKTFPQKFDEFYLKFKQYYDHQDWVDEKTSCHEIERLAKIVMPQMAEVRLLDVDAREKLDQELDRLSDSDWAAIDFFRQYLEAMNTVVDRIWDRLNGGNVEEAILLKLDFEAQISPSLKRSNEALGQMSDHVGAVSKA